MICFFHENSEAEIYDCLKQVDTSMPRSISSRTHSLKEYAYKLYSAANVIIAREKDDILGICAFYTNRNDYAYLTLIAIIPQYRGRGFGAKLLEMAEATACNNKLPYMMLEVDNQNITAIRFYTRHGYNSLGSTETKESIYMRKQLIICNVGENQ